MHPPADEVAGPSSAVAFADFLVRDFFIEVDMRVCTSVGARATAVDDCCCDVTVSV